MALLTKKQKTKVRAGASAASTAGKAGSKVLKAGSALGKVAKFAGVAGAVVGGAMLVEKAAEKLGVRGGAGFIGKRIKKGHHRKGKVPKQVKKWAKRITSRRKQEEKIVKDLFGAGGGKIIKKPKFTHSEGIITKNEAMKALRS